MGSLLIALIACSQPTESSNGNENETEEAEINHEQTTGEQDTHENKQDGEAGGQDNDFDLRELFESR